MRKVTLIPGDGTGPEITNQVRRVLRETGAEIEFEEADAGESAIKKFGTPLPDSTVESVKKNKVALKGPITTPIGTGFRSVNVGLRKALDLYANVRPCEFIEGTPTPIKGINLVVIRENTEDLYAGIEEKPNDNEAKSIKIITRKATERIAKFAFEYAVKRNRKKITIVHKANIMKFSDGLFLQVSSEVASQYPNIQCEDRIVDNMAMQLVQKPQLYDMLLCPNLYGDILSDLCAGLVGGLGVAPAANFGEGCALFEAVHGSAPKYAGMNKVNPTALILTAGMMMEYLGDNKSANMIKNAVTKTTREHKKVTYDLGGTATMSEMTDEIIKNLK